MININDVYEDEQIPAESGADSGTIGRQARRVRTAMNLEQIPGSHVDDATVGDRVKRLVTMSIEHAVAAGPNKHMYTVVEAAIQAACAPGGAIQETVTQAIQNACEPQGAIQETVTQAIQNACEPQGAVNQAMEAACNQGGAIHRCFAIRDRVNDARYINERVSSRTGTLAPLPGLAGVGPANFPSTLQDFWSLIASDVNTLLEAYGLSLIGSAVARKERLALHCRIQRPID